MTMASQSRFRHDSHRLWFYGSNRYVLQCLLSFLIYEHFGFQGLHVANGGEDRSFHLVKGSATIQTSGLVR